jgi:hypothetical protein
MALYSTAALLAFIKKQARRPSSDESQSDGEWYAYMSRAQRYWIQVIATVAPEAMMGAPTAMSTSDSGVTYTFATASADSDPVFPIGHVELYDGVRGVLLRPGTYDDVGCDYVIEGNRVRFPGNVARTFPNGLYARFVDSQPVDIAASSGEPVLKPLNARELIAYRALILWAEEDGGRDPTKWMNREQALWFGNPQLGDMGILGTLRSQHRLAGMQAIDEPASFWWRGTGWGSRSL